MAFHTSVLVIFIGVALSCLAQMTKRVGQASSKTSKKNFYYEISITVADEIGFNFNIIHAQLVLKIGVDKYRFNLIINYSFDDDILI